MDISDWFLLPAERGNDRSALTRSGSQHLGWSTGNEVRALVHGRTYFAALLAAIQAMRAGDLLCFTDWRGDPDQLLAGPGTEVGDILRTAAGSGVLVRGLVWRSHLDRLSFSEQQNRHLGAEINAAGGQVLRDMRVRAGGSHHQKFVVLRHPGRPEADVAFVGGIDLCHSRLDDAEHAGDMQRQPMAKVYGDRPPWHDAQLELRGPVVFDVETVFRERWDDPSPLNRNPLSRMGDRLRGENLRASPLPRQLPPPAPRGTHTVQVLRTYPDKHPQFPFAPGGERTVARGYRKAAGQASRLIYLEDQYLWNPEIVAAFATALRRSRELRLIAVIPRFPDQDGSISMPPNLIGRQRAIRSLQAAGPGRVAVYGVENHAGTPVYVHAKVAVIDDQWVSVGSANLNRRSWTHDSELACAVLDTDDLAGDQPGHTFARRLRLELGCEHLDLDPADSGELIDPQAAFALFAARARDLQLWHEQGRTGPRPPGRLRPYPQLALGAATAAWSSVLYRTVYDPDGRAPRVRLKHEF